MAFPSKIYIANPILPKIASKLKYTISLLEVNPKVSYENEKKKIQIIPVQAKRIAGIAK